MYARICAAALTGLVSCIAPLSSGHAVEGMVLYTRMSGGGGIYRLGELRLLVIGGSTLTIDSNVHYAQLSPDGTRIAYVRVRSGKGEIVTAARDGSGKKVLRGGYSTSVDTPEICWRQPNSIAYAYNKDKSAYAIDVNTGNVSVFYTSPQALWTLSIDTQRQRMNFYTRSKKRGVWTVDLSNPGAGEKFHDGGCGNWISPSGKYFTNNLSGGGHQDMAIRNFDGSIAKKISIRSTGMYWNRQKWSNNSDDWFIYPRGPSNQLVEWSHVWVRNFKTGTAKELTSHKKYNDMPYDFWVGKPPGTTPPPAPSLPAAPSNLTASAKSASQIALAWKDNSGNEDGFKIERRKGGGSYAQIATAAQGDTAYSDGGLSASTTYTYRVRAYNAAGNSSFSNEAGAKTQAQVGPPTIISPVQSDPLVEGTTVTLTGSGSGPLQWSYDANSDGKGAVSLGTGTSVSFQIPMGVGDPREVTVILEGPGGTVQRTFKIDAALNTAPSIAILSPQGGEAWMAGSTQQVRWSAENLDVVVIQLSTDGGKRWKALTAVDGVEDTDARWGDYPWIVPDTPSAQCVLLFAGYFGEAPTKSATFEITSGGPDEVAPKIAIGTLGIEGTVDDFSISSLTLAGTQAPISGGRFSTGVPLNAPSAAFKLIAADAAGNAATRTLDVQMP